MTEDKDFIPKNVKKDTCVAVAYSMLTGMDYDDALKMFPNGKMETIQKKLDIIKPEDDELILNSFMLKHPHGKYLVSITDKKHNDGHALAVIDGVAYNTQDFDRNSDVLFYSDLSNIKHSNTNETSYLDEFEKHKNIKDNKYINYAYQKIVDTLRDKITTNGKINTKIKTFGTEGFELDVNNNKFEFSFPFNSTDKEIYSIIDDIIEKTEKNIV